MLTGWSFLGEPSIYGRGTLERFCSNPAVSPAEGTERVRKKKSRWEEPSPSTAVALVNVPKEITLPGGIKVVAQAALSRHRMNALLSSSVDGHTKSSERLHKLK